MPAKRELSMRQLRHLLRLHHGGVSAREIGRRLGVARSTVQDNLKRAASAGLAMAAGGRGHRRRSGTAAVRPRRDSRPGQRRRVEPDWAALARELKRAGVTMMILWEEYRADQPRGYGYSRFCDLLRGFERRLSPVMRQHHVAGEKAFVDYSGKRISIVDPTTGEIHEAEIFVGVLGASNLTYAEATWTQQLPDWTGAHVRMFRFFRRRSEVAGSRQSEERRQQSLVLRSRDQPNLWRDGSALLGGNPSGATLQATRQGEGRGRRQICSDVYPRTIARADLLLARRMQRRPSRLSCSA